MLRLLTLVLLFTSFDVASFDVVDDRCPDFSPNPDSRPPTSCELIRLRNDEIADADKVMENFVMLADEIDKKTSGGGCSVEQVDNTAAITCADGTTAVVPGYGTVVVYPEGQIGETNIGLINTGEIVLIDGNDVTLGSGTIEGPDYTTTIIFGETASCKIKVRNNDSEQVTEAYPWTPGSSGYFQSSDCSGQMLIRGGCHNPTSEQWVIGTQLIYEAILIRSQLTDNSCSETEKVYSSGYLSPPTNITLPAEILNAAYPVRLEQLP